MATETKTTRRRATSGKRPQAPPAESEGTATMEGTPEAPDAPAALPEQPLAEETPVVEDTTEDLVEEEMEAYMPPPGTLVHRRGCPALKNRIESHFDTKPNGTRLRIRRCLDCGEQVETVVDAKGNVILED